MGKSFHITSIRMRQCGHLSFIGTAHLRPGVNVLIGRNGSGKTTLLLAIKRAATSGEVLPGTHPDGPSADQELLAELAIHRGGSDTTTVTFRHGQSTWSNWQEMKNRVYHVTSDRSIKADDRARSLIPEFMETELGEPSEQLNIAEEFYNRIRAEFFGHLSREQLQSIVATMEREYRDGLVDLEKVIHIDFSRPRPVYFTDSLGREVTVENLSHGEKEFLYFYSFLKYASRTQDKIILIDEPELHLHASQIRKICDMLRDLSKSNQVILATHSPEVLQYFLRDGNIVRLDRGHIRNVSIPDEFRELVERIGMPVDPSVFTSHWIVAENEESTKLKGGGPVTDEVLSWLFGNSLERRYWAFGSSKAAATGGVELLKKATANTPDIRLTMIIDGDDRFEDFQQWPPAGQSPVETSKSLRHLPCWELENLFLSPEVLRLVSSDGETPVEEVLWNSIAEKKNVLANSVMKTLAKRKVSKLLRQNPIGASSPAEDLARLQEALQTVSVDEQHIHAGMSSLIESRGWKWLPGKEVLGILSDVIPDFWDRVRKLDPSRLREALLADEEIGDFVTSIITDDEELPVVEATLSS